MLKYKDWRKIEGVINKSKQSCSVSNINVFDHFVGADKMVKTGDFIRRMINIIKNDIRDLYIL